MCTQIISIQLTARKEKSSRNLTFACGNSFTLDDGLTYLPFSWTVEFNDGFLNSLSQSKCTWNKNESIQFDLLTIYGVMKIRN